MLKNTQKQNTLRMAYVALMRKLAAKQVKDDAGQVIANCPVLYLKDGEACVFAGAAEPIMLPDKSAKDKIASLRSFLRFGGPSDAT